MEFVGGSYLLRSFSTVFISRQTMNRIHEGVSKRSQNNCKVSQFLCMLGSCCCIPGILHMFKKIARQNYSQISHSHCRHLGPIRNTSNCSSFYKTILQNGCKTSSALSCLWPFKTQYGAGHTPHRCELSETGQVVQNQKTCEDKISSLY